MAAGGVSFPGTQGSGMISAIPERPPGAPLIPGVHPLAPFVGGTSHAQPR